MKRRIGVTPIMHAHRHAADIYRRAFRHFPVQIKPKSGVARPGRESVEKRARDVENLHEQRRSGYRAARRSTMTSAIPPRTAMEARAKRSVIVSPRKKIGRAHV